MSIWGTLGKVAKGVAAVAVAVPKVTAKGAIGAVKTVPKIAVKSALAGVKKTVAGVVLEEIAKEIIPMAEGNNNKSNDNGNPPEVSACVGVLVMALLPWLLSRIGANKGR